MSNCGFADFGGSKSLVVPYTSKPLRKPGVKPNESAIKAALNFDVIAIKIIKIR